MIEIVKQNITEHTGETYRFEYQTQHYFHPAVTQSANGFSVSFERCAFASKEFRGFESALNQPFLENPSLFFAYDEQKRHIGLIELSRESWNNRLRVSNLLVFPSVRHQGVGTMLMNTAKHIARTEGFRGIVLENKFVRPPLRIVIVSCYATRAIISSCSSLGRSTKCAETPHNRTIRSLYFSGLRCAAFRSSTFSTFG